VNTTTFQALLEAEVRRNQMLQGAITTVCDNLGVKPDANIEEDASGVTYSLGIYGLGPLCRGVVPPT
jgi:hypothetical protein